MNNLDRRARTSRTSWQRSAKHTWVMAWLYIGTFGSFIGYSAAFPLLIKTQFPQVTTNLAFLGALVGSVARPLGGKLADRIGGARLTFWNFVAMALAALGVIFGWTRTRSAASSRCSWCCSSPPASATARPSA